MDSTSKQAFYPPGNKKIDGLNLSPEIYEVVFNSKIDDTRLSAKDDVLVATYARTGTTWISHIISLLVGGKDKFQTLLNTPIHERVPYLEFSPPGVDKAPIKTLHQFPTPRVDKTHLPYRFIKRWIEEDEVKTIVTTRHPKDTLASLYHFYKSLHMFQFNGTWDEFFEHFKAGYIHYGDQLAWYQDFAQNVPSRHNVLYVKYEDMKENLEAEIRKISKFLAIEVSDDFIHEILNVATMKHMKKDVNANLLHHSTTSLFKPGGIHIRKGACGEWKKYFTVDQNEWFDSVYRESYDQCALDIAYD